MAKGEGKQSGGPGGGKKPRNRPPGALVGTFHDLEADKAQFDDFRAAAAQTIKEALTPEQRKAIRDYTSEFYRDVNGYLRGTRERRVEQVKQAVEHIDAAFKNPRTRLDRDVLLYRKVGPDHPLWQDLDRGVLGVGNVYSDAGYQSASTHSTSWTGKVLMRIKAPKGSSALHIQSIASDPSERETLLPRNTSVRVTGYTFDKARGTLTVDVDLL